MSHSILDLIGNTPLVASRSLNANPRVTLLFKMEGHNPGGSVKDRAAYHMIKNGFELYNEILTIEQLALINENETMETK